MKISCLVSVLLGRAKAFAPPSTLVANRLASNTLISFPSSGILPVLTAETTSDDSADSLADDAIEEAMAVLEVVVEDAKTEMAKNWGFILTSGVLRFIGGVLAMLVPVYATDVAYSMVAWSIGVLGGIGVVGTFVGEKGMRAASLLFGVANIFLYARMWKFPFESLNMLSAYILAFTVLEGVHETAFAFQNKDLPSSNWNLFSGVSAVAVGIYAAAKMPVSSFVVPGICLGVNLISSGITKVAISLYGQEEANQRMGYA